MSDQETITAHLQALIRCQTISHEDGKKTDWSQFKKLHQYIKTFYPVLHNEFSITEIGEAGLQFCWKTPHPRKAPLMLMSHQDVVETGELSQWQHSPFSADLEDGIIWGRGTTDCKHLLTAELEAVNSLFAAGWRPDYDLYISLGFGEEIYRSDGPDGARLLCQNLQKQGIQVGCIFDEGGSILPSNTGKLIAHIGLGEKACVNFEIYKDCAGGHSSKPGSGTALGAVAKAIVAIESNPYPYRLTPLAKAQLEATAAVESGKRQVIFKHPEEHWEELCQIAKKEPALDAMLHTTFAFTMASASTQPNVMPSHVSIGMSCRILQGDTIESVTQYLKQFLPDDVHIRHISGEDPMPASTPDSDDYHTIETVLRQQYGPDIITVPFLMLGATDTHYYAPIAHNVFRFDGYRKDNRWGDAHQINERIPADALLPACNFFKTFLQHY